MMCSVLVTSRCSFVVYDVVFGVGYQEFTSSVSVVCC